MVFGDVGYDEGVVNLVLFFDDVCYGGGFGDFGDLFLILFCVVFWLLCLNVIGEDVFGEWL